MCFRIFKKLYPQKCSRTPEMIINDNKTQIFNSYLFLLKDKSTRQAKSALIALQSLRTIEAAAGNIIGARLLYRTDNFSSES